MLFKAMKQIYLCVIKEIACSELDWLYETGVATVNLEFLDKRVVCQVIG